MKEADIRPTHLFDAYLELCAQDAQSYFAPANRKELDCPACGNARTEHAFDKWGFGYRTCAQCQTLYQSPRPSEEQFSRYYQDSPSARYWATVLFPAMAEARRERLFAPKVAEIARLCARDAFLPRSVADIGAGSGLFLEEWRKVFPQTRAYAMEPHPIQAEICRSKGLTVLEHFAEDGPGPGEPLDLVVALEVIEHVTDPLRFCSALHKMVAPGGRLLLTGLTADGFDILTLWERSKSVAPPQHINFMTEEGFQALLARAGFAAAEVFTPGKLDVDIVANHFAQHPDSQAGQRFARRLLDKGPEARQAFQTFLAGNRLSSHCWIWATRTA